MRTRESVCGRDGADGGTRLALGSGPADCRASCRRPGRPGWLAGLAGLAILAAAPGWAAPVALGDFTGATLTFQNVVADDGTLFGPAALSGDTLEFAPRLSSGSGGAGASTTLSTLTFGISAQAGFVIDSVLALESGLYTLFGTGTSATSALSGLLVEVTVDEVDGAPIAPVSWNVNASVSFNLLANPGDDNPWSLGVGANIMAGLTGNAVPFLFGATHVLVSLSNTLTTESEAISTASISKDLLRVSATTSPVVAVPAPGAAGPWMLGLGAIALFRRRGGVRAGAGAA